MACNIPSHGGVCPPWGEAYFVSMETLELGAWNVLFWGMAAVIKFIVTPSAMVASGHAAWTAWAVTSGGAALGVWSFWNFGKWWFRWLETKLGSRLERGKRVFTPKRRRIVRLKNALGFKGLLFISGMISVPLASVLGAKYFRDQPAGKWLLMMAFVLWAGVLTLLSWALKHGLS